MNHLRGNSRVTQQGEELCRVGYDLSEYARAADLLLPPAEFEGRLDLLGGVPLNAGLPDLVLELMDGRRVSLEVTAVHPQARNELYEVRGHALNQAHVAPAEPRTSRGARSRTPPDTAIS